MKRRRVILVAVAALIVILGTLAFVFSRQRLRRHRYFRAAPAEQAKAAGKLGTPDHWTDQFRAFETLGRWGDLAKILDDLSRSNPDLYNKYQLGYLHARALIEHDESREAMRHLAPFVANGNRFRDLALFHQAEIDETRNEREAASRDRQMLILEYPNAMYRDQAIDDETEYLTGHGDPQALSSFAARIYPSAPTARRRDLDAHLVELLVRRGDAAGALQKGIALLRGGTMDDPAERTSRALDRPELIRRMSPDQQAILGDAFQNHRHFDRAIALLSIAIRALPQKHDNLQFAIGRCYFGDEKYPQAQQTYMAGANTTRDPRWKATFLFHASRAAQLQGDDATSERLMTGAIAVPGRFPSTTAALTQRMRTRLKQRRFAEAASDLAFIRKNWPRDHAVAEASLGYAIGMLGAGNAGATVVTLNAIPRNLLDKFEPYEIDYWRARALENSNPPAAFAAYLNVLRAPMPTHFAYFARQRLDAPAMAPKLARELAVRDAQVNALIAAKNFELARRVQTDRILLSSSNHPAELKRLADIYRQLPVYRTVLELKPEPFP